MKKMNTITIIALALIFFGGVGAILLAIGQSISSAKDKNEIINTTKSENSTLKNDLAELKNERNKLGEELAKRDLLLRARNDTIIDLNHKLSEKSEYIQNYLTGGTGYPIVELGYFATDNFNNLSGMFKLRLVSNFPLYNLIINIFDYDKLTNSFKHVSYTNNPVISMEDLNSAKVESNIIDAISPKQTRFFDKQFRLTESRYYIQLQARNNIYIEKLVSLIHGTTLYFGYQILTLDKKIVEQWLGDNSPSEVQTELLKKLHSIPTPIDFDVTP